MFTYVGSGGATTNGCAKTARYVYITYTWGEGSIAFLKYKAQKGVLEKVAIKQVILNAGPKTYNKVIPLYRDTLNSLYNEEDLISEADARSLAIAYWERVEADAIANQCHLP